MAKPARVLVVDDEARNLRLMESMLQPEGYEIRTASNGPTALDSVANDQPDLVLLDVMMPGMDGFQVAGKLKLDPLTKRIPIIMLTSLSDRSSRLTALNMGAEEFITKPVERAELWMRVRNLLRLKEYSDFLLDQSRALEQLVEERTEKLTASYRQTIMTLNRAASYRDEETGAHVQRISHYCVELASALGMDASFRDCIFYASPMHDIGKIAIPDRIMLKKGPLDADEWEIMKSHAALGAQMLQEGQSPYLEMGREIALGHHERWDGSGYPGGLAGEATPLAARIMSIGDVYDALRSNRPYKPAFGHEEAFGIITRGDRRTQPVHFDPQVLAAFVRCEHRMHEIYDTLVD